MEGDIEPFHSLPDFFPGSRILAFELDTDLCKVLNEKAESNIKYFPVALGEREEKRTLYETAHPMCSSLYRPNEELLLNYNNLECAMLKSESSVGTESLDSFIQRNHIDNIDFIKIDIQGAELDVFKGGGKTLKDVVFIISEVEFIPLYTNQPLFGDVCNHLWSHDFMFHKFKSIAGRTIKPFIINDNPNFPSQHMWSDAVFMKKIHKLKDLASDKLLKTGVLSYMYESLDVALYCFKQYDERENTNLYKRIFSI